MAGRIVQPLREHAVQCLALLEGAAATASPPPAGSPAASAGPPAGSAASAAGVAAVASAEAAGAAGQQVGGSSILTFGAVNEDVDAMLTVQRLIYALDRVLDVLRG